jgi:hypothetical protein
MQVAAQNDGSRAAQKIEQPLATTCGGRLRKDMPSTAGIERNDRRMNEDDQLSGLSSFHGGFQPFQTPYVIGIEECQEHASLALRKSSFLNGF